MLLGISVTVVSLCLGLVGDDVGVCFFGLSCGISVEISQIQSSWLWITCYYLPMNIDPVL